MYGLAAYRLQLGFKGRTINGQPGVMLGSQVSVLARVQGKPVLVRQNKAMAATFHPELTRDARAHGLLLDMTES